MAIWREGKKKIRTQTLDWKIKTQLNLKETTRQGSWKVGRKGVFWILENQKWRACYGWIIRKRRNQIEKYGA